MVRKLVYILGCLLDPLPTAPEMTEDSRTSALRHTPSFVYTLENPLKSFL